MNIEALAYLIVGGIGVIGLIVFLLELGNGNIRTRPVYGTGALIIGIICIVIALTGLKVV